MKNALKILFRFLFFLKELNIGMSKGAASSASRKIDDSLPGTWEFSSFSQNGEDGVIDYLVSNLTSSNKYFKNSYHKNLGDNFNIWREFSTNSPQTGAVNFITAAGGYLQQFIFGFATIFPTISICIL